MRKISYIVPAIVVVLVLALSSVFIVDERNKALVLQFGRVVAIKEDPGLSFKLPFIQNVVYYEDRILSSAAFRRSPFGSRCIHSIPNL